MPAQAFEVERRQILCRLAAHLDTAAEDFEKVGDDVILENFIVIGFQAVEDLAAHRHDGLKFTVAALFYRTECGITLDDIQLTAGRILGAAVHELLHTVSEVNIAGQLLFDIQTRLFRLFAAALVN